jgi:hypothetical protein
MKFAQIVITQDPILQPLLSESLSHRKANIEDEAHADIAATDFWSFRQRPFIDVSVQTLFLFL